MNVILPTRMTVDEFLRWSLEQDRGRYELEQGRVVMMSPQNADHARTKARVYSALWAAIERAGLPLYAMPDGMTVRLPDDRAYEPDALVAPLPMVDGTSLEVPDPVVVVEVLSPTPKSQKRDLVAKVAGYALHQTIEHYLVVDPEGREVLHYRRIGEVLAPPAAPSEGTLRLDPPGLEILVEDLLIPAPAN